MDSIEPNFASAGPGEQRQPGTRGERGEFETACGSATDKNHENAGGGSATRVDFESARRRSEPDEGWETVRRRTEKEKPLFDLPQEGFEDQECEGADPGRTLPVPTSSVTVPGVEPHGLKAKARVSRNPASMDEGLLRQIRAVVPSP